jgi:hypothetical protein
VARPWERQPDDTDASWNAFICYRDLGVRRSLPRAGRRYYHPDADRDEIGVTSGQERQFEEWSAEKNWVERSRQFDAYEEAERLHERRTQIREAERRHAQIGMRLQAKGLEALEVLELDDFDPADILRWVTEGAKLERLALGESTSNEQVILVTEEEIDAEIHRLEAEEGRDPGAEGEAGATGGAETPREGTPISH